MKGRSKYNIKYYKTKRCFSNSWETLLKSYSRSRRQVFLKNRFPDIFQDIFRRKVHFSKSWEKASTLVCFSLILLNMEIFQKLRSFTGFCLWLISKIYEGNSEGTLAAANNGQNCTILCHTFVIELILYKLSHIWFHILLKSTNYIRWIVWTANTAQKMKFSIKDFFSKCDQIRSFLIPKWDGKNCNHICNYQLLDSMVWF